MAAKWRKIGVLIVASFLAIVVTFSLWSLSATARHNAFCQHVESASKFVYGETSIEQGTRPALKFLKQASGIGQPTVSQLRGHQNSLSRENWSQTLWVIEENELVAGNAFAAGC